MELLEAGDLVKDLVCPVCGSPRLEAGRQGVSCAGCERWFPARSGVIDFVLHERLNPESEREIVTNAIDLASRKAVRKRVRKGEGNLLLAARTDRAIRAVQRLMAPYHDGHALVSIGSGSGFELPYLLRRRGFERVLCSDLAWSAAALAPAVTGGLDGRLGLFAADFDHLPVRPRADHVGFVFLALHHAEDPHRALARLLQHNFDHLVLVEPITNWLVEVLARLGLARRREYSGVRPQWLSVRRMRHLAREEGFRLDVETWWELPRDRLPKRMRASRNAWRVLYAPVDAVSWALRPLRFGSMAAIRFERGRPIPPQAGSISS